MAVIVLLSACSAPQSESAPGEESSALAGPDAQQAHAPIDWPFVDREAFAAHLRELAQQPHGEYTGWLRTWMSCSRSLGFDLQAPFDLWSDRPGPTAGYETVVSPNYGHDGWTIGRWEVWDHDARFDLTLNDRIARVAFVSVDGAANVVPPARSLADTIVVAAPGNGRLVLIDMRPAGLVDVLPYAFDGEHDVEQALWTPGAWVFRDENAFVQRLKSLNSDMLATATNEAMLQVWADSMKQLGIAVHGVRPTEPASSVQLGHGFSISAEDASDEGWMLRRPGSESKTASPDAAALWIQAHVPLVVFLGEDGLSTSVPKAGVDGTVLLVSTADGRLVAVELSPQGLVSVLPQAFE
ncbi:MAG TPA: hypothetical protein VFY71_05960 [Planctomycetota bacterium]|nr:hypothetical protein [Planctomycetota bacterium]